MRVDPSFLQSPASRRGLLVVLVLAVLALGVLVLAVLVHGGAASCWPWTARSGPRTGEAIPAPGPQPDGAPAPPGLVFTPAVLDLGGLASGEVRTVRASWRRTGGGPLTVHGLLTSCGCLAAGALPPTIAEGGGGALPVEVRAPRRPGPFSARLDAVFRRGRTRWVVRGWVEREVAARPARIDLGLVSPGRAWERRVRIYATAEAGGAVPSARLEGIQGSVRLASPLVRGEAGWSAEVTATAPSEPGPFAGTIAVAVGGTTGVVVPVRGEVVRR